MNAANQHAIGLIEQLSSAGFWGMLTFRFQHGQIVHITKEESIQPAPDNRRNHANYSN